MKVMLCKKSFKVFNVKRSKPIQRPQKAQIELFENTIKPKRKLSNVRPIFIVGMPRSGTTLVEQIISAHSMVYGAGELNQFLKNLGLCYLLALSHQIKKRFLNLGVNISMQSTGSRREGRLLLIKCPILFYSSNMCSVS